MTRRRPLPVPVGSVPFVLDLAQHAPPLDFSDLFGRTGPVELEVGCGKGLYLAEASAARPEVNLIGVERAAKFFHRAVERLLRAKVRNVRLVKADAFDLLTRWVPERSLATVHVYFPDPWPKKRHAKRRLLQGGLYTLIHRALQVDGTFQLASDVEPYFQESLEEVLAGGGFTREPWPDDAPDRIHTSYARKYLIEGRRLHYARFRRVAAPPASARLRPEER